MYTSRATPGTARYIGRIGQLAIALGIGAAMVSMPGTAEADTGKPGAAEAAAGADSPSSAPRTRSTARGATSTLSVNLG